MKVANNTSSQQDKNAGKKVSKGRVNKFERESKKRMQSNNPYTKEKGRKIKNDDHKPPRSMLEIMPYLDNPYKKVPKFRRCERSVLTKEDRKVFGDATKATQRCKDIMNSVKSEKKEISKQRTIEEVRMRNAKTRAAKPGKMKQAELFKLNREWRKEEKKEKKKQSRLAKQAKKNKQPRDSDSDSDEHTTGRDEVAFGEQAKCPPDLRKYRQHFEARRGQRQPLNGKQKQPFNSKQKQPFNGKQRQPFSSKQKQPYSGKQKRAFGGKPKQAFSGKAKHAFKAKDRYIED